MRTHALAAAAALSLLAASAAHAQNRPAAEAAFRKGKDLLAAGKVADACASFEQSQKLDPQLGTEYNLALCNERLGKLASAWAAFSELSARDSNARRKADAAKRARALEPRLTRMLLTPAEPVPGLVITQDGADVTVLVGVASPVDPGTYQFSARAPGYRTWTQPVAVGGEGKTVKVDIPVLDADPTAPPSAPADPAQPTPAMPIVGETPPARASSSRRWIGLGVGAGGVVSVGVGLVFGLQARNLNNDAKDLCGGSTSSCDPANLDEATDKVDDAKGKGMISNVAVGVGLVAVGAGLYLYLTAPSGEDERAAALTPVIGDDQLGFAVSGRF